MTKLKYKIMGLTAVTLFASAIGITSCCFLPEKTQTSLDLSKYELVWEDNFETFDKTTWTEVEWDPGHVNHEVQSYIKGKATIVNDSDAEDGKALRLTATGSGSTWESSRIHTSGNYSFTYGYAEARLRMPKAYNKTSGGNLVENLGVWPAFWMMPEDARDEDGNLIDHNWLKAGVQEGGEYGPWPRSGELDIMEYSPSTAGQKAYSTIHHALSTTDSTDQYESLGELQFFDEDEAQEYHTYGLLWTNGVLEAYYDGKSLGVMKANPATNYAAWPFDKRYHIILNLAMGGDLGGSINADIKSVEYDIDYVKVYKNIKEAENEEN